MAGFAEGEPCWAIAVLPDLEAGKRFYGELLGWSFGPPGPGRDRYTEATVDGRAAAGLMAKPDGRMPTDWALHLATKDVAVAVGKVAREGGRVIMDPFAVGDAGITAVCADPGGAVFQLWQAGERPGFEAVGLPGAYAWAEVYTRDKDAVDAFYPAVFGFATRDASGELGQDFLVWSPRGEPADDEHAVGGRALMPADVPEQRPAHFLTYFRVADCDAAVRVAGRLGGRTVREPEDTPYGRLAVLVDNQGAQVAVLAEPEEAGPDAALREEVEREAAEREASEGEEPERGAPEREASEGGAERRTEGDTGDAGRAVDDNPDRGRRRRGRGRGGRARGRT